MSAAGADFERGTGSRLALGARASRGRQNHNNYQLMGGSVMLPGLFRDHDGILHRTPSPYGGAKILAGASGGDVILHDPKRRLEEA